MAAPKATLASKDLEAVTPKSLVKRPAETPTPTALPKRPAEPAAFPAKKARRSPSCPDLQAALKASKVQELLEVVRGAVKLAEDIEVDTERMINLLQENVMMRAAVGVDLPETEQQVVFDCLRGLATCEEHDLDLGSMIEVLLELHVGDDAGAPEDAAAMDVDEDRDFPEALAAAIDVDEGGEAVEAAVEEAAEGEEDGEAAEGDEALEALAAGEGAEEALVVAEPKALAICEHGDEGHINSSTNHGAYMRFLSKMSGTKLQEARPELAKAFKEKGNRPKMFVEFFKNAENIDACHLLHIRRQINSRKSKTSYRPKTWHDILELCRGREAVSYTHLTLPTICSV